MKFLTILLLTFSIFPAMAGIEKCNYKLKKESTSHWGGAPWADGTWKRTQVIPKGPCESIGEVSESSCINAMRRSNYSCYQMTSGNRYRRYDGTYWGGIKRDYKMCFVCY